MRVWMSKGLNEGVFHVEEDTVYWIQDTNFSNKETTMRVHIGCLYVVLLHFYEPKEIKQWEN